MKFALAVAALVLSAVAASPANARARAAGTTPEAPAVVAIADAASTPIPRGKLTDAARPLRYRLDLTVDPAKERFSGKVEIDVTLARPSTFVDLHGRDLAMQAVHATVAGERIAGVWKQEDPTGVARIRFDRALPAGPVTLHFAYDAPFLDGAAGLFRVKVADAWYSWSQFQSIDARAAFPGFDQPSFKTPFSLTLRTPPGLVAIGNAPENGVTRDGDLDVHRFADTLPLPTYLVAMMVGPFATVSGEVPPTPQRDRPLPLRIAATKPNADRLGFALENSKPIVALLEDYFADGFPYPKLDQIASPIMPGAMENAGADLYGDQFLLIGEDAPTSDRRTFGMFVSHELAHQWFGDLVTPAWWDDLWLNESFANWMGYAIGDKWRSDLNIASGALEEGFAAMETDQLAAGRPIRQKIETNAQIDAAFDTITYGKGGHVVAMIADYIGRDRFRDGVRRYMAAHRNGNATSDDFFAAMADSAGDPRILPAMRSFVDQQGVPLVTFAREGSGWTATQARFVPLGSTAPAQRWGIPLCVRRGAARNCQLMTEVTARVDIEGVSALVPNAGGTGYYRFELAKPDWDDLIAEAGSLEGGEALAVTDSLSASVRSGDSTVAQLAELARVLANHRDSYAADAAMGALSAMVSGGVVGDAGRRGWRQHVVRVYRPVIDRLGLNPALGAYAGEDPQQSQKRARAIDRLSGAGRDPKVQSILIKATDRFFSGKRSALDPAWYAPAFDLYIGRNGLEGAKALMDTALRSDDPAFRPAAITAIAASGQRPIAHWLLEELDDPRMRPSEKRGLLAPILAMRTTREYGYDWMRAHLDSLLGEGGGIFYASKVPQWLGRFCAVDVADKLQRDLMPRFAGGTGELEMARVIERVRNCGVLKERRGDAITAEFAALK